MTRLATASLLLATVLAAPVAAQVDGRVRLTDVGDGVTYNFANDGIGAVYIGHYGFSFVNGPTGTFASMPGLSGSFDAWCVDFDTSVSLGQAWDVNLTRLTETSLTATRLGRSTTSGGEGLSFSSALSRYKRAAWLTTQFALYANSSQKASVWGAIHAAIWNITRADDPQPTTPSGLTGIFTRQYWIDQSLLSSNTNNVNLSEFVVMSATPNIATAQEFLIRVPTTPTVVTPEPVTMFLVGSGLVGMGIAGARRRRKNKSNPESESEDNLA